MNLKQIEDILNENLAYLVDMACYSGDISEITKVENNIKSIIPVITQLLEELREEDIDEKITDINYADGYNQRNQILNSKIDKILNNQE